MPLPKRRHSKQRGRKRRTHYVATVPALVECLHCGENETISSYLPCLRLLSRHADNRRKGKVAGVKQTIAVDCMGADHGPLPLISGAVEYSAQSDRTWDEYCPGRRRSPDQGAFEESGC